MYGLAKDFDGSEFVGQMLELVSFASNVVVFGFGDQLSVSAFGRYQFSNGEVAGATHEELPVTKTEVVALLGLEVSSAEVREPGDFVLRFIGGASLVFEDDTPTYEAYSIATASGRRIV